MPSVTLQGVVLRYAGYRERDRMLTLLTPDHGRVDVLSRGCKSPKSALMTGSELFVHGEFVVFQNRDRFTLTSCAPADTFYPLRMDPYRLTCATYLLNLAQAAAQPEQPAEGLFSLLLKGLYRLAYSDEDAPLAVVSAFLLLYADEIGYRPRLNHCVRCGRLLQPGQSARLDILAGGLCCDACQAEQAYPLSAQQADWMRKTIGEGLNGSVGDADSGLFAALRAYVESRLETCIKCSQFLP